MCRIFLLVALSIAVAPVLDWPPGTTAATAEHDASASSTGRPSEVSAASATARPYVAGHEHGRRAAVHVVWDRSDAQQKAETFLGSHHAHREAIASTQQCRMCHSGPVAGWTLDRAAVAALQPNGPWIGVSVGPADGVLRSQLRLPEGTGVVVTQVVPDGPAHRAGMEVDDVLLSVNGKPVAGGDDLDEILQASSPEGPPLTLKLLRAGEQVEKQVTPGAADANTLVGTLVAQDAPAYRIGVHVTDPDRTLRRQLKLGEAGLVVTEVKPESPAAGAGVKAGDVLLSVGGKQLVRQYDLGRAIRSAADSPVDLGLLRGGVTLNLKLHPAKEKHGAASADPAWPVVTQQLQQPRDLMLVYPSAAQVVPGHESVQPYDPAATRPAAQPSSDRLDGIAKQLDELRRAVDALRDDFEGRQNGARDGGE